MPYNTGMEIIAIKTDTLASVFGTKAAVAKFFGCTRQSITDWGDEIPELRAYQLKDRRPDIFDDIVHGKYD